MVDTSEPLNTDLRENIYLLWKIFTMPSDGGGKLAVAVPESVGSYFISVYTIILGSIFAFGWQFVTYLIITFYPTENDSRIWSRKDRKDFAKDGTGGSTSLLSDSSLEIRRNKANRYIALVCIWNTTDPASAMLLLMEHAWIMCTTVGDQITGLLDVIVLLLSAGFMISAAAARVLISSSLFIGDGSRMGNVAPINSSSVFWWADINQRPLAVRSFTFGGSSALRAAGAAESIADISRQKVAIFDHEQSISYNYSITGVEFGLQHASSLVFHVNGSCSLQYNYINTTSDQYDIYQIPYLPAKMIPLQRSPRAPIAIADYSIHAADEVKTGNISFGIVFETVLQQSFSAGTDPMYETEDLPFGGDLAPKFAIKRGRPWLDCWEQTHWTYKDITVYDPNDINKIPDSVVSGALRDELIPFHFTLPRFPIMMRVLGGGVLVSSSSSYGGVIDAGLASWRKDMGRLILINYIMSRNAFRDSTLLTSLLNANPQILTNGARDKDGKPKPGLSDIVVATPQVTTMSLAVLIIIPAVWVLIWIVMTVFRCNRCTKRNSGKASRFTLRAVGLQAVQMYRLLDEEVCGHRDDWEGRKTHMPYILKAKRPSPNNPNPVKRDLHRTEDLTSPTDSDTITYSSSPQQNLTTPLFAAPKVEIDERDHRYHLKFTGPVDFEPKGETRWTWKDVAGRPRSPKPTYPIVGPTSDPSDVPVIDQTFNGKGRGR